MRVGCLWFYTWNAMEYLPLYFSFLFQHANIQVYTKEIKTKSNLSSLLFSSITLLSLNGFIFTYNINTNVDDFFSPFGDIKVSVNALLMSLSVR